MRLHFCHSTGTDSALVRGRLLWFGVALLLAMSLLFAGHCSLRAASGPDEATQMSQSRTQTTLQEQNPFLTVVPTEDGTGVLVAASTGQVAAENLYISLGIGEASHKEGWTMTYSDTVRSYLANVPGFSPVQSQEGRLNITTTLGLASGEVEFVRAYLAGTGHETIFSPDGRMEIQVHNEDTLPAATYIAVTPSFAPPAPPPDGLAILGSVYSARAAGALSHSQKPFLLRLYYRDDVLNGRDPDSLSIHGWDGDSWYPLDGRVFEERQYVSVATDTFTTYALMAACADSIEFAGRAYIDSDRHFGSSLLAYLTRWWIASTHLRMSPTDCK